MAVEDNHYHTLGVCAANLILVPFSVIVWLLGSQLQRFTHLYSILKVIVSINTKNLSYAIAADDLFKLVLLIRSLLWEYL